MRRRVPTTSMRRSMQMVGRAVASIHKTENVTCSLRVFTSYSLSSHCLNRNDPSPVSFISSTVRLSRAFVILSIWLQTTLNETSPQPGMSAHVRISCISRTFGLVGPPAGYLAYFFMFCTPFFNAALTKRMNSGSSTNALSMKHVLCLNNMEPRG
jgi:hypothetical protein